MTGFAHRLPGMLLGTALCLSACHPAGAVGPPDAGLSERSPAYRGQVYAAAGEYELRLRLGSDVRSVSFRVESLADAQGLDASPIAVELVKWPPKEAEPALLRGQVAPDAEGRRRPGEAVRVFRAEINLAPRDREVVWLLRLRTVPPGPEKPSPQLRASLRVEADARGLTARERDLMAWRERTDPLKQPDAVRAKIAELTDEEVRFYTGFKDRANFLKYWGRTKAADIPRGAGGGTIITEEILGLFVTGNPLPNGKYLHHNGRPLPLE